MKAYQRCVTLDPDVGEPENITSQIFMLSLN